MIGIVEDTSTVGGVASDVSGVDGPTIASATREEKLSTFPDWDVAGALSIVVQGGLSSDNMGRTAVHCAHWRDLFPHAEIILAISVTDVLAARRVDNDEVGITLTRAWRESGQLQAALAQLQLSCDKIVISPGALPLPPIKTDSSALNNANLQIVAARAGLAAVRNQYVLRVRSDFVFLDRRFLDQYHEGEHLPRGVAAVLKRRVLVSWLYTLNPYTTERMPLHVSDWFHFGLTEDVARIWNVPPMTFRDAVHHRIVRHRPEANMRERLIIPRRAVEQHILYNCFTSAFPALELETNEDWSSRDLCVDIVVDNFNLCDVGAAGCLFDKYAHEFEAPERNLHCITRRDWLAMAAEEGPERRQVLIKKRRFLSHPETEPFPRTWLTSALRTKQGSESLGEILSTGQAGVLLHGPYAVIPAGRYLAVIHTSTCRGPGTATLRVTLEEGRRTLAEKHIELEEDVPGKLEIAFDLLSGRGADLEVVCIIKGEPRIIVTGLTVAERPAEFSTPVAHFHAAEAPMATRFGIVRDCGVGTANSQGHLLFGPLISLAAGSYNAIFSFADVVDVGAAVVEVASAIPGRSEQKVLIARALQADDGCGMVTCPFELEDETHRIEFRVFVDESANLTIREVALERL